MSDVFDRKATMRVPGRARTTLITIGTVVGLIVLVLASLSLIVQMPSVQAALRSRIESALHTQLDREVEIGDVRLGVFLRSLDIRNIRIASGERLQDGVLAEIEGIELYPNLLDLLRFRIVLNRIVVHRPTVTLPQAEKEPATPPPDRPTSTPPSLPVAVPLGIQQIEVRDATLRGSGMQATVARLHADLHARAGAIGGTLKIDQTRIQVGTTPLFIQNLVLQAEVEGDDIQVTGLHISAPGADVAAHGRVLRFLADPAFDLTLKAHGGLDRLFPEGPPVRLQGDFSLEGKVAGPLADPSFTGRAALGTGRIEHIAMSGMSVAVQANRRELRLKELTLKTASGDLSGDVGVTWDKLRYDVALRGEAVDLAEVLRVTTGDAPVGGQATFRVQATGEGADLTKGKGQATLRVKEFHLSDHPKDRGTIQFVIEGQDGRAHIRQGEVELARTRLRTTGVVKLGGDVDLDVDMRFSKLEDFGRLLGTDPGDLAGRATLTGRLTGSVTDPVLRASLNWTEATLLDVVLDNVRGPLEVSFDRRTLTAPSLTVLRQELRGLFDVVLTLGSKPPDRKILLKYDLTLDIKGEAQGPLEELLGIFAKGSVPLSGPMRLKAKVHGTPATLTGDGVLALTDVLILDEPWEQGHVTVKLHLQKERVWLESVEVQRGQEKAAGRFEIDFDGNSQFDLSSSPLAIERLAPLQNSGLTGTVTVVSARGDGPIGRPRLDIMLKVADLAHRDVKVGDGQGTLTWDLSQDQLKGQLSIPERGYMFQPTITTKAPHPFEATLTLKRGDVASLLRIAGYSLPAHVSGVASGRIDVAGRLGEVPERVTVNLTAVQFDIQGHSFHTEGPTRLNFQEGKLTIAPVSLRGEGGTITVGGTIADEMDLKILGTTPTALATVLSPEVLEAKGMLEVDLGIQGSQELPRYRGTVRTPDSSVKLRVHPEPIEHLQGEVRLTETAVEATGLKARWGGGTIDATLHGRLEERGWGWQFQFDLEDARCERVLALDEEGKKDPVATGPLRARGGITVRGGADVLATLGGQVRLEAVKGVIHHSVPLENALRLINLSFLFDRGAQGKGLPYDELSATFDLENGIAKTEDSRLRSPVLRAATVGQIDLPQRAVDAQLAVHPLQLTDKVLTAVSDAPIIKQVGIGTLLFGRGRTVMVVTYRVQGSLADPEITRVPARAVDRGISGIFARTLELPADVFGGGGEAPAQE
jgi:autotransporter translocation and assembly factor TamB